MHAPLRKPYLRGPKFYELISSVLQSSEQREPAAVDNATFLRHVSEVATPASSKTEAGRR